MNPASGATWSSTAFAYGLDLAAKATATLVIVLLIQNLLGRRRALLGSTVGNAGLVALFLLPLSAAVFPSMPIACLPASADAPSSAAATVSTLRSPSTRTRHFAEDTMTVTRARDDISVAPGGGVELIREAVAGRPVLPARVPLAVVPPAGWVQARSTDWSALAIAAYVITALILLVRIATSMWAVARLQRSCEGVGDTEWSEALARWRRRLGIGRTVVLASSPRVNVPLTLGWLRPTVLLPSSLTTIDGRGHADAVLLHELCHVRRNDFFWNVLLRFVQALYWPHVLVWLLGRAIAEVRERACDDLCVHEIGGPMAYRETLLAVASNTLRGHSPALGLAMAEPSRLGRRLARIERSNGNDRCLPCWPARLAIVTMVIAVTSLIGAIQLIRAEATATTLDDPSQTASAIDQARPAGDAARVFHLQVVAADTGEPVPDADVRVWINFSDDWRKADAQGRLDITHSTGPSDQTLSIDVWGKGRAMQRHRWGEASNKPIPDGATIKLQSGEGLGGVVQDEAGRPIAGATILLWSHNYKKQDPHELFYDLRAVTGTDGRWHTSGAPETTGELLGFQVNHPDFLSSRDYGQKGIIPKIADLRAGKAVTVMKKGVPIEGRVVGADGKPVAGARVLSADDRRAMFIDINQFAVFTDTDGRFRTWQVSPGEWFLVASAKGHAHGEHRVWISTAVPQVEITLGRPRPFKGRVVDPQGKPIAGAFVHPAAWRGYRCLGVFLWTDADGRFRWDDAPGDEWTVNVNKQGYPVVSQQRVAPSDEDVVFTLKPAPGVVGTVRDAQATKLVEKSPPVQAKAYARIEGQYRIGSRPVPNQELALNGVVRHAGGAAPVVLDQKATTDAEGRFTFENVVPVPGLRIARRDRKGPARGIWSLGEPVHVEPGKTTQFMLGGKGRPVIGRVEPPSGWTRPIDFNDRSEARLESYRPWVPYPLSLFRGKTPRDGRDWNEWHQRWVQSPEGDAYRSRRVSVGAALAPDGSFRFDDVPAGEYRLVVRVNGESISHVAMMRKRDSGPFSHIGRVVTVPPVPGGRSDEPLDLGALRLEPRHTLEVGDPAPAIEVTTIDGKMLAVPGDFRGKFLLIDFGTLWDIAAPRQIALLNEVNQKFGKDPRFAILSLTLEADTAETRKSIADKGEPWMQAIVGPLSNPIASAYGIDEENVSTAILINPDGKVAAKELWGNQIGKAVGDALGTKR